MTRGVTKEPTATIARRIRSTAGLLVLLALQFLAVTANHEDVLVDDHVYFVDADCYSRMTRVASIVDGGDWSIRFHAFENWPTGTLTHTTAPLDFLIIGLAELLPVFGIAPEQTLDLAGAWISPLLAFILTLGLWLWMGWMRLKFRWITLLLVAVSPMIVQAVKLGRPDHQSLVMLLIACAVAAEVTMWLRPGRGVAILWGFAWACAMWVSLFEPLILFVLIITIRAIIFRKSAWKENWLTGWLVFGMGYGLTVACDGWRIWPGADPTLAQYFPRWASMLGELARIPLFSLQWIAWTGAGLLTIPILVKRVMYPPKDRTAWLWLILLIATFALSMWQLRWACYFVLLLSMALPFALDSLRLRSLWINLGFVVGLWPVAAAWEATLYPEEPDMLRLLEQREENIQLRAIASAMSLPPGRGFIAPWWISPAVAYWSGQPGVGGSSHQSLAGIADTAKFFISVDPQEAQTILNLRKSTWVIVDDPVRTLSTSAQLLGTDALPGSMGNLLFSGDVPPRLDLTLIKNSGFYQLYRKTDRASPTPSSRIN